MLMRYTTTGKFLMTCRFYSVIGWNWDDFPISITILRFLIEGGVSQPKPFVCATTARSSSTLLEKSGRRCWYIGRFCDAFLHHNCYQYTLHLTEKRIIPCRYASVACHRSDLQCILGVRSLNNTRNTVTPS